MTLINYQSLVFRTSLCVARDNSLYCPPSTSSTSQSRDTVPPWRGREDRDQFHHWSRPGAWGGGGGPPDPSSLPGKIDMVGQGAGANPGCIEPRNKKLSQAKLKPSVFFFLAWAGPWLEIPLPSGPETSLAWKSWYILSLSQSRLGFWVCYWAELSQLANSIIFWAQTEPSL